MFFKEGDTLRLKSDSKKSLEDSVTIVVPKDKDTTNKSDIPNQDTIKNGKVSIEIDKQNSTVDLNKVRLPTTNEFDLDSLKEKRQFVYRFIVPRDSNDDRVLSLIMHVKNKKGEEIKELSKKIIVYVKPLVPDSLTSSKHYEFWLMTGTNFDLFDGIKAQEFFFRANTLFRFDNKFLGQIAFYKNRYFTVDTVGAILSYTNVKRPGPGDSIYTITSGSTKRTSKQTIDPLGFQVDGLFKLLGDSTSSFFATAGFDFSTTTVTINYTYNYLDSLVIRTARPDTIPTYSRGLSSTSSFYPQSFSYKKPNYNLNVGFMWILNEDEVNIKAHLSAGISKFSDLVLSYPPRGSSGGVTYASVDKTKCYLQLRMFATYKPMGICFGLESYIRQSDVPAFNFTLSKAFDIKHFINNFTPVSALKLSK